MMTMLASKLQRQAGEFRREDNKSAMKPSTDWPRAP